MSILELSEEIKPKVIIGENVDESSQLVKKIKDLNEIVNTFEKIGYDVSYKILDVSHFGVPQSRRLIFINVREDVTEERIIIYEYYLVFFQQKVKMWSQ